MGTINIRIKWVEREKAATAPAIITNWTGCTMTLGEIDGVVVVVVVGHALCSRVCTHTCIYICVHTILYAQNKLCIDDCYYYCYDFVRYVVRLRVCVRSTVWNLPANSLKVREKRKETDKVSVKEKEEYCKRMGEWDRERENEHVCEGEKGTRNDSRDVCIRFRIHRHQVWACVCDMLVKIKWKAIKKMFERPP